MTEYDTSSDNSDDSIPIAQHTRYDGDCGEDPGDHVPWVQLVGGDKPQSTIVGDGARVDVAVDDQGVTITVDADLEDAERLLDRDMISVQLCAKNLPKDGD